MTTTIDPTEREALLEKYRRERDKRLREDGNDQYVEVTGAFAPLLEDPGVERAEREPLFDEVTVAFIGGGFAGLVTGARLKQAGINDVRIIEKGGEFGGTWYWNRYPGAQCDTHSFVYLPLLEETGHMPSEKYAHAPEILEHCRRIGRHFDLYDNACLGTEVIDLEWDPAASRWIIRTDRGDEMRARFVVMGTGPLHKPKLPGIPGIESFRGHTFHTSRWDYDYTGGDPAGAPLERLGDKRVAIVGTGATAVQCIPHLARACEELYVFQRTPSSIDVRANEPTDPAWFEREVLATGWQEEWLVNFCTIQTGGFTDEDLVKDGWTDIARRIRAKVLADPNQDFSRESLVKAYEDSDFEKMAEIRSRVDEIVQDSAAADALKPWYRQLCKRPCFHDEYLSAYNEPGIHLIDTDGQGVERITERGVVAAGVEYEVDCIIYASGFEVGTDYVRRSGYDVSGRDGRRLSEHWAEGMRTLHGMHVHGFPNAFVVGAAQGANLVSNYTHNLSEAAKTVAAIIERAEHEEIREVEATAEAEQAWVELLLDAAPRLIGAHSDCTPGYYNNEGQPAGDRGKLNWSGYPDGPVAFFAFMERWRTAGDFDGLDLRPAR
ncbi:NAD(P)/FAD-dependent oxidoreductase [soil metagenome]